MRAIDAKAAVAALRIYEDWRCPATSSAIGAIQEAISIIVHEVPTLTIDDLRPKGRWGTKSGDLLCSVCGRGAAAGEDERLEAAPYCPWCGAKMEEDADA